MKTLFTRLALFVCLCLCLSVPSLAQAPLAAPSIVFSLPDGATVLKSVGLVTVTATASYPPGLRSLSLSGGFSGGSCFFSPGTTAGSARLYFYCGYFPTGNYVFTATATGVDGKSAKEQITLLVK